MRVVYLLAAFGWLCMFSSAAGAEPCDGFVDVDSSSTFCSAATFLKDRHITTGCTDAAHFCPNDGVTRLQMALFLQRFGSVIATKRFKITNEIGLFSVLGDTPICTISIPAAPNPRIVLLTAAFRGGIASFSTDLSIHGSSSADGAFSVSPAPVPVSFNQSAYVLSEEYDLAPGASYSFWLNAYSLIEDTFLPGTSCSFNALTFYADD